MKKRFLAALLSLCMTLTLLPTTAFAAVSDSLGNTPEENQAILEQLSALTGGSSDQVLSMLNALGLLDEDGNFKVDQTITLDGQVLTLAAVMELLENPATDLTRIADVDGTPVALGDLKTMIQIEQELQRIKDTYFSGREFTGEALKNLNSLMEQLELQGISLQYSASATKPEGVETVDMSGMMSQTLENLANNTWSSGTFTVYSGKPVGFSYRIQKGQLSEYITGVEVSIGGTSGVEQSDGSYKLTYAYDVPNPSLCGCKITVKVTTKGALYNDTYSYGDLLGMIEFYDAENLVFYDGAAYADTGAYRLPAAGKGYKQRGLFIMTDFEKIHSFESLYNAYRKARQGKRWKGAAAKFEVNLLEALNLLSAQIRTKRYTMSPYNTFEVYEPKRRVVMSNSYKDKVVQHSLCDNVLEPILTRSFIRDNYASQVGKGTHYGLDRLQEFMRRFYRKNGIDGWILKGDISKYFYSIRHDVLKTLIREKITDPDVLWLVDLIIGSTEGNVGIPIGNQTSQLFALLYLDGLDHFVKEKLGIKYYGRYMDDFFLIHHDKAYLQECRKQIEAFVQARGLSLNAKTNIFPLKHGVDFLGFHTYLTESGAVIRKVRRRSKNNMKRKLKKLAALHAAGRIDAKTVEQSYQSWRGHAEKGNCYHLIRRTDHYYNRLFNSKEAEKCQKH